MVDDQRSEYFWYRRHHTSKDLRISKKEGLRKYDKVEGQLFINYPHLAKIKQLKNLALLFRTLPDNIRNHIVFYNQYKKKLTIAVSASAFQQELVYKKDMLRSIQKMIKREKEEYKDIEIFETLKVIVDRKKIKPEAKAKTLTYIERAQGGFENLAKNEKIKEKLEEIRREIQHT